MSASKIGSSTIFTAACTTRSRPRGSTAAAAPQRAGLGNEHPAGRQRTLTALPQLAATSSSSRDNPVLLDIGDGDPVDARRAAVAAHLDPRPLQDVPAMDLVLKRVEPSPGIGLGRPVKRMLQGTDRVPSPGPRSGGTSPDGTHRAPPRQHYAPTKQRPFPHRRLCCPPGSTGTTAASDAHPASDPLPGVTGYRTPRSGDNPQVTGPGRASPVPAVTI